MWTKFLNFLGIKTEAQEMAEIAQAIHEKNQRRLRVAHEYLDGNDGWKTK